MLKKIRIERVLFVILCIVLLGNLAFTLRVWRVGQEEPYSVISQVPYVIERSGNYVLSGNLACPGSAGACIEIRVDHVFLDLRGYALRSSSSEPDRSIYGIYAKNRSHITIVNGMVEGFFYGIYLEDISRDGRYQPEFGWHTVESVVALGNTFRGIRVEGLNNTVTNNVIAYTGGSTFFEDAFAIGIESIGSNAFIVDNRIFETYATDNGEAVGISLTGTGEAILVRGNMIANSEPPAYDSWGIWASGNTGAFIFANTIFGYNHGLGLASQTHGMYEGNLVYGAEAPYIISARFMVDGGNNRAVTDDGEDFLEFEFP